MSFLLAQVTSASVTSSVGPIALDLTQGPINDLCNQTTSIAFGLFFFFGLVALIVEAFGHGPEQKRDFSGIAWRAILVLLLLKFYSPIFRSVITTTQSIADEFKPLDANSELSTQTAQYFSTAQQLPLPANSSANAPSSPEPSWIGTKIYESAIHLLVTLGQAAFWVFGVLARIAELLFYVIGPLALVASLPRASQVGSRWFGHYVGVCCWPILGAIVVRIILAVGVSGLYSTSALGHVCVALALGLAALATPVVTTALVGGSVATATQHGFKIAQSHVSKFATTVTRTALPARGDGDDKSQQQQAANTSGSPGRSHSHPRPPHNAPGNSNP